MASDLSADLGDISVSSLVTAGLNDLFTPSYLARYEGLEGSLGKVGVWFLKIKCGCYGGCMT
jgi:hypothetical protein